MVDWLPRLRESGTPCQHITILVLRYSCSLPVCPLSADLRLEMLNIRDVIGAIDMIIHDLARDGGISAGKLRMKEDQTAAVLVVVSR